MRCLRLSVCMLALLVSPVAVAQPSAGTPDTAEINQQDPEQLYERGRQRAQAGDWQGALADYRDVFELRSRKVDWRIASNHANAADKAGHPAEAARMFRYADDGLLPGDPDYAEFKPRIAERRRLLDAQVGAVAVTGTPAGATLYIDGVSRGVTPLAATVYLKPGSHKIRAVLADVANQVQTVQVTAGQVTPVTFARTPAPAPTNPVPTSPVEEEPAMGVAVYGGVIMIGLGVAGLAAATVLGVTSADRSTTAAELAAEAPPLAPAGPPCSQGSPAQFSDTCIALSDNTDAALSFEAGAIGAGVAGGALLIGGIVMLVTGASGGDDSDEQPAMSVTLSPHYAGAALTGVF